MNENHIKNLVALAKVDGHVHSDEVALLFRLAEKYNYDPQKIRDMLDGDVEIAPEIPQLYSQRLGQLYDLVEMMLADNKIDENELEFCEHMAELYGFESKVIQSMIDLLKMGEQTMHQWEEFEEKAKEHLK